MLLALLAPYAAHSDAWDESRARLIDPLNAALHRHWPAELKNRNIDVLLRLYSTETGTGITWQDPERVETPGAERTLRWSIAPGEQGERIGESIRDR